MHTDRFKITFHDITRFDPKVVEIKAKEISDWAEDIENQGHTLETAIDWITTHTDGLFTRGAVKRLVSIGRR